VYAVAEACLTLKLMVAVLGGKEMRKESLKFSEIEDETHTGRKQNTDETHTIKKCEEHKYTSI